MIFGNGNRFGLVLAAVRIVENVQTLAILYLLGPGFFRQAPWPPSSAH